MSASGTLTSLYSFTVDSNGASPNGLVEGSGGYFYGTTQYGGSNSENGTVFKISTNGALTRLYSFTNGIDGANPLAGLVQTTDGDFYGTTPYGGSNGEGTVFKINTNGTLTTLHAFGSVTNASGVALDGANPVGELVQGSDGYFYGTTEGGGVDGMGTVFRLAVVVAAAPMFQGAVLTGSALMLTWSTAVGGMYQLQNNSDLIANYWTNVSGRMIATGGTLTTTNSITNGPQRFYRLVLVP
jgi:uncharacterized repeat protein (TIGR03803 family)